MGSRPSWCWIWTLILTAPLLIFLVQFFDALNPGPSEPLDDDFGLGLGDARFCNGFEDCSNGDDEPEGCHQFKVIVVGSDGMDGIYSINTSERILNYYQKGHDYLLKKDLTWVLARGLNPDSADTRYHWSNSHAPWPFDGWLEGQQEKKDLKVTWLSVDIGVSHKKVEKGYICKAAGQTGKWLRFPDSGACDSQYEDNSDGNQDFFKHFEKGWIIYR